MGNENERYEQRQKEKQNLLKKHLDDKFLKTLVESVKTCGHDVDYFESTSFVEWCFSLAGKPKPDLSRAYE